MLEKYFFIMPLAIDVGQRVLVYNPSHGWTTAYFVRAQQTNDNKLQILVNIVVHIRC